MVGAAAPGSGSAAIPKETSEDAKKPRAAPSSALVSMARFSPVPKLDRSKRLPSETPEPSLRDERRVRRMHEREPRVVAMLRHARDRVPTRHHAPLVVDRPVRERLEARRSERGRRERAERHAGKRRPPPGRPQELPATRKRERSVIS